ncbi:hypothetical protein H696_00641 [Fonticula alba]|uniref:Exocyst complex subunit Exo70 C-terminal domain-containing protein n=1 Tax=Fonticula alba TaxID=691883 RepID=A0A058ZGK2_FONAL|nr:hypothetical protein H696_00641 [Fonticula alba]KCV73096.1 hypothetical protein H696_00641 [Fonticula alba]|eukprot:XP_009492797.1 hypothetical protein H696_00641 [Fonticula alba]
MHGRNLSPADLYTAYLESYLDTLATFRRACLAVSRGEDVPGAIGADPGRLHPSLLGPTSTVGGLIPLSSGPAVTVAASAVQTDGALKRSVKFAAHAVAASSAAAAKSLAHAANTASERVEQRLHSQRAGRFLGGRRGSTMSFGEDLPDPLSDGLLQPSEAGRSGNMGVLGGGSSGTGMGQSGRSARTSSFGFRVAGPVPAPGDVAVLAATLALSEARSALASLSTHGVPMIARICQLVIESHALLRHFEELSLSGPVLSPLAIDPAIGDDGRSDLGGEPPLSPDMQDSPASFAFHGHSAIDTSQTHALSEELQRSKQLAANLLKTIARFERRLTDLDKIIQPVRLQTTDLGNLQGNLAASLNRLADIRDHLALSQKLAGLASGTLPTGTLPQGADLTTEHIFTFSNTLKTIWDAASALSQTGILAVNEVDDLRRHYSSGVRIIRNAFSQTLQSSVRTGDDLIGELARQAIQHYRTADAAANVAAPEAPSDVNGSPSGSNDLATPARPGTARPLLTLRTDNLDTLTEEEVSWFLEHDLNGLVLESVPEDISFCRLQPANGGPRSGVASTRRPGATTGSPPLLIHERSVPLVTALFVALSAFEKTNALALVQYHSTERTALQGPASRGPLFGWFSGSSGAGAAGATDGAPGARAMHQAVVLAALAASCSDFLPSPTLYMQHRNNHTRAIFLGLVHHFAATGPVVLGGHLAPGRPDSRMPASISQADALLADRGPRHLVFQARAVLEFLFLERDLAILCLDRDNSRICFENIFTNISSRALFMAQFCGTYPQRVSYLMSVSLKQHVHTYFNDIIICIGQIACNGVLPADGTVHEHTNDLTILLRSLYESAKLVEPVLSSLPHLDLRSNTASRAYGRQSTFDQFGSGFDDHDAPATAPASTGRFGRLARSGSSSSISSISSLSSVAGSSGGGGHQSSSHARSATIASLFILNNVDHLRRFIQTVAIPAVASPVGGADTVGGSGLSTASGSPTFEEDALTAEAAAPGYRGLFAGNPSLAATGLEESLKLLDSAFGTQRAVYLAFWAPLVEPLLNATFKAPLAPPPPASGDFTVLDKPVRKRVKALYTAFNDRLKNMLKVHDSSMAAPRESVRRALREDVRRRVVAAYRDFTQYYPAPRFVTSGKMRKDYLIRYIEWAPESLDARLRQLFEKSVGVGGAAAASAAVQDTLEPL